MKNRIHICFAAMMLMVSAAVIGSGCDDSDAGMVGGKAYPKIGSSVDVHFKKNYLGLAGEKPTTPISEGMGMQLGTSGVLKRITDEFVVLQVHGEPNRELWVPRDTILMLDVKRPEGS